jgi:hypothetical protein
MPGLSRQAMCAIITSYKQRLYLCLANRCDSISHASERFRSSQSSVPGFRTLDASPAEFILNWPRGGYFGTLDGNRGSPCGSIESRDWRISEGLGSSTASVEA